VAHARILTAKQGAKSSLVALALALQESEVAPAAALALSRALEIARRSPKFSPPQRAAAIMQVRTARLGLGHGGKKGERRYNCLPKPKGCHEGGARMHCLRNFWGAEGGNSNLCCGSLHARGRTGAPAASPWASIKSRSLSGGEGLA
jgi:hypothetical protein